jgi:hypothetical protein
VSAGAPFQVAQDDGQAVPGRQFRQFMIQYGPQLCAGVGRRRFGLRQDGHLPFPGPPAGAGRPGPHGRGVGDTVQPIPDRLAWPHRARLADQDEEGRLEGVLGVLGVVEDAPADAQDHRAVPS